MYIGKVLSAYIRRLCKMFIGVYALTVLAMIETILESVRPPLGSGTGPKLGFRSPKMSHPREGVCIGSNEF